MAPPVPRATTTETGTGTAGGRPGTGMPGDLTGIDLARLVKREWPAIQVLLTTGYVDGDETIEDLDLLYKPYRAADLAEKIQTLLHVA